MKVYGDCHEAYGNDVKLGGRDGVVVVDLTPKESSNPDNQADDERVL